MRVSLVPGIGRVSFPGGVHGTAATRDATPGYGARPRPLPAGAGTRETDSRPEVFIWRCGPAAGAWRCRSVGLLGVGGPPNVASPVADAASAVSSASPAGRRAALPRRWAVLLVVGWAVQAGLRAWLSRGQVVPLATPDESAYLIAARVLAGGQPANFSYSTLYPAGYPLLITPVFWFTSNPVTAYHAVLMINSPISAALMPLAYLACRRLRLDRPAAYGVAAVAALLPA